MVVPVATVTDPVCRALPVPDIWTLSRRTELPYEQ
jgi:hypothetical protein